MHAVIDFHCDLLAYLGRDTSHSAHDTVGLGCGIPYLKEGPVKVQVCAIFSDVVPESPQIGQRQAEIFSRLEATYPGDLLHFRAHEDWAQAADRPETTVIAALEGAATICNEDQPLAKGLQNLDRILAFTGPLAYISLTHHKRNRFGGGNYEPGPVTADGKILLEAMVERSIPLCLSHTSDALAESCLEYLDKRGYDLPVLASHSNYRQVLDEPRNLPDHLVQEVVRRQGVIGLNVLRKFMHPTDPDGFYQHVAYAREQGASEAVVFGADYFHSGEMPPEVVAEREPFYLPQHQDARFYPSVLQGIAERHGAAFAQQVAWKNGLRWLNHAIPLS